MKPDSIFTLCTRHSSSSRGWKSPLLSTPLPLYECVLDLLHAGTRGSRTPPAAQKVIHWPMSCASMQGSKRSSAPHWHPMCCPGFWNIPYVKTDLLPPLHLFLLFLHKFCHCISKVVKNDWEEMHEAIFQIRAFLQHLARPISCFQHAVPWQCALIPYEVRKSLHSCHFQFLPKRNTSYKGSAHYSWIINEAWYFREVQIGGILHIVRIPILFSWYVVPSAARRPRRCGHSPEITSALHYRYHISIIYTLSDKWKCFHKNNLESWLKTQVCCQDKQSSLKEDLFLFCSDKYVVSGL